MALFVIGIAVLRGALEVGDDEAEHAVGDVAGQCVAQGLEAFGAEARDGLLDERAVVCVDVARDVEGAARDDALGQVLLDGHHG